MFVCMPVHGVRVLCTSLTPRLCVRVVISFGVLSPMQHTGIRSYAGVSVPAAGTARRSVCLPPPVDGARERAPDQAQPSLPWHRRFALSQAKQSPAPTRSGQGVCIGKWPSRSFPWDPLVSLCLPTYVVPVWFTELPSLNHIRL